MKRRHAEDVNGRYDIHLMDGDEIVAVDDEDGDERDEEEEEKGYSETKRGGSGAKRRNCLNREHKAVASHFADVVSSRLADAVDVLKASLAASKKQAKVPTSPQQLLELAITDPYERLAYVVDPTLQPVLDHSVGGAYAEVCNWVTRPLLYDPGYTDVSKFRAFTKRSVIMGDWITDTLDGAVTCLSQSYIDPKDKSLAVYRLIACVHWLRYKSGLVPRYKSGLTLLTATETDSETWVDTHLSGLTRLYDFIGSPLDRAPFAVLRSSFPKLRSIYDKCIHAPVGTLVSLRINKPVFTSNSLEDDNVVIQLPLEVVSVYVKSSLSSDPIPALKKELPLAYKALHALYNTVHTFRLSRFALARCETIGRALEAVCRPFYDFDAEQFCSVVKQEVPARGTRVWTEWKSDMDTVFEMHSTLDSARNAVNRLHTLLSDHGSLAEISDLKPSRRSLLLQHISALFDTVQGAGSGEADENSGEKEEEDDDKCANSTTATNSDRAAERKNDQVERVTADTLADAVSASPSLPSASYQPERRWLRSMTKRAKEHGIPESAILHSHTNNGAIKGTAQTAADTADKIVVGTAIAGDSAEVDKRKSVDEKMVRAVSTIKKQQGRIHVAYSKSPDNPDVELLEEDQAKVQLRALFHAPPVSISAMNNMLRALVRYMCGSYEYSVHRGMTIHSDVSVSLSECDMSTAFVPHDLTFPILSHAVAPAFQNLPYSLVAIVYAYLQVEIAWHSSFIKDLLVIRSQSP